MKTGVNKSRIIIFFIAFVLILTSTASSFEVVSILDLPGSYRYAGGIEISGNYAYIASFYAAGLTVVDIIDPYNPHIVATLDTIGCSEDITIKGNFAYIGLTGVGLWVVNISNPTSPFTECIKTQYPYHRFHRIFRYDHYILMACCAQGMCVFDISNPTNPIFITGCYENYFFDINSVIAVDNYAYLSDIQHEIYVVDIADPTDPSVVSDCTTPQYNYDVAVSGQYAFTANTLCGLTVSNIYDPLNPYFAASLDTARSKKLLISDQSAILAGTSLYMVDIADPTNPYVYDQYDGEDNFVSLESEGNLLYVVGPHKLHILRLENTPISNGGELPEVPYITFSSHPNPFNTSATIEFTLPEETDVKLSIYNLLGQKITIIYEGVKSAGKHSATWNAGHAPSGVYFARLETERKSKSIKLVLLK